VGGEVAFPHARRGCRRRAGDVNQILDGDGDAVKRTAIAPGRELAIGLARLLPCRVRHDEDKRVQLRVVLLDAAEAPVGDLFGSEVAVAQPASELFDGQRVVVKRLRRH
jgi:hypothetical protein